MEFNDCRPEAASPWMPPLGVVLAAVMVAFRDGSPKLPLDFALDGRCGGGRQSSERSALVHGDTLCDAV